MKEKIVLCSKILIVLCLVLSVEPAISQEIMHTSCHDAKKLLTHAVSVGSPNARIYTRNDWKDNFARSVWDMQLYNGRVYFGCGDSVFNRGPIVIWSFTTDGDPDKVKFICEFKACQESVEVFRVFGDKMYVPGINDSRGMETNPAIETTFEPDSASVYVKSGDKWHRYNTIRYGAHIFDVAEFQGKLYAVGSAYFPDDDKDLAVLFESTDGGRSWNVGTKQSADKCFFSVFPFRKEGLILGTKGFGAGLYLNREYKKISSPLYPPLRYKATIRRMQQYDDGVVYTTSYNYPGDSRDRREGSPLMFLKDINKGAKIVELFKTAMVEDIVINGHSCTVLTSKTEGDAYRDEIYTSQNLKEWVR